MRAALLGMDAPPVIVDIRDPAAEGEALVSTDNEALVAAGNPAFADAGPSDEWDAITLN